MIFIMNMVMVLSMSLKMAMNMTMVVGMDLDTNKEGPLEKLKVSDQSGFKRILDSLCFEANIFKRIEANRGE